MSSTSKMSIPTPSGCLRRKSAASLVPVPRGSETKHADVAGLEERRALVEDGVELRGGHGRLGEVHHPRVEAAGALEIVDVVVQRLEAADADGLELHGDLGAGGGASGWASGTLGAKARQRGAGGLDAEQGGEAGDVDAEAAGPVELRDEEQVGERDRVAVAEACRRRRGPPSSRPVMVRVRKWVVKATSSPGWRSRSHFMVEAFW